MKEAIQHAVSVLGGQSRLAAALGVTPPAIAEWRKGTRPVPLERCVQIERATSGAVRRWDLRPDDWHLIWPELVGTEGAPEVPQEADRD